MLFLSNYSWMVGMSEGEKRLLWMPHCYWWKTLFYMVFLYIFFLFDWDIYSSFSEGSGNVPFFSVFFLTKLSKWMCSGENCHLSNNIYAIQKKLVFFLSSFSYILIFSISQLLFYLLSTNVLYILFDTWEYDYYLKWKYW